MDRSTNAQTYVVFPIMRMFHVRTASEWNMISRIGDNEIQSEKGPPVLQDCEFCLWIFGRNP